MEVPGIVVVESTAINADIVRIGDVCFAEELDSLSALALQLGNDVLPVADGDGGTADIVAAEAIDIAGVYPELQGFVHLVDETLALIVQLVDVAPSVRVNHLPLVVLSEILRM